ncbi:hypothetical protein HY948_04235 [Candidatus Gottesmanbacteria bacterium]|nr:hypothetical protein [Candidatus Gottesmanbacteria bacterium]
MGFEKIKKRERSVEKKKEYGKSGDACIGEQFFCQLPGYDDEKKESQGVWDVEGPVDAEAGFFQKSNQGIKKKVVANRNTWIERVLERFTPQEAVPVITHGKRTDERDMAAEIAPGLSGDKHRICFSIVGEGVNHEPKREKQGKERKQDRQERRM